MATTIALADWRLRGILSMPPMWRDRHPDSLRAAGRSGAPSDAGRADELATELTNRFWERLRYFAMRRLRDRTLAEDVAQEVIRRALEALRAGRVVNRDALPAFLFQTARHVCMQRSRSAGREERAYARFSSAQSSESDPSDDPLQSLIGEEQRAVVRQALVQLDEDDRQLLEMTFAKGLATDEIAQILSATPGAIRVRRHRALGRLAEILGVTPRSKRELL